MSPMLLYHVSPRSNRESILATGLELRKPSEHNWAGKGYEAQPKGVYLTYEPDCWYRQGNEDRYAVTYIGPAIQDPVLDYSAIVALEPVPAENLTIIEEADSV
jgi:hypothetical protein